MQALIIDDEKHCRDGLAIMLSKFCPMIEVVAQCPGARQGQVAISQFQPDLVFLDIEMPGMNGFELLKNCRDYEFDTIFTTAYNEYAIQAVRHSALDYLLKPINKNELIQAVARANGSHKVRASVKTSRLIEYIEKKKPSEKIALPAIDGLLIVDTREIFYCESENNYTRFYLANGKNIFVSKTLKKVETLLTEYKNFYRIHHSFIINLDYLQRYLKGDGGKVILTNGKSISVSRGKRQDFLNRLEKL